ncbi:MAG: hypothetical protein FJW27_02795 [Acidimicrobiia bacterium]|nr:hypothetical protein [Acidimicrobiia bacterium]
MSTVRRSSPAAARSRTSQQSSFGVNHKTDCRLGRSVASRPGSAYTLHMAAPTGTQPARSTRPGRNERCYCGSGRKYKQCCLAKDEAEAAAARAAARAAEASVAAETTAGEPTAKTAPPRPPKHQTHQPWKATTSKGFAPKTRMPRKAGGS